MHSSVFSFKYSEFVIVLDIKQNEKWPWKKVLQGSDIYITYIIYISDNYITQKLDFNFYK